MDNREKQKKENDNKVQKDAREYMENISKMDQAKKSLEDARFAKKKLQLGELNRKQIMEFQLKKKQDKDKIKAFAIEQNADAADKEAKDKQKLELSQKKYYSELMECVKNKEIYKDNLRRSEM